MQRINSEGDWKLRVLKDQLAFAKQLHFTCVRITSSEFQSLYLWNILGIIIINKVQLLCSNDVFHICMAYGKLHMKYFWIHKIIIFSSLSHASERFFLYSLRFFFPLKCIFVLISHLLKASSYPKRKSPSFHTASRLMVDFCFINSKVVYCIVNLLHFPKIWNMLTIVGATQMCHSLKVDI